MALIDQRPSWVWTLTGLIGKQETNHHVGEELSDRRRSLGDRIIYNCPSSKVTWDERLKRQVVTCIWHRQTDTMMWWPQDLQQCNS